MSAENIARFAGIKKLTEDTRIKYEAKFARRWEARFLSHLDVMRALSRALRRSGLPVYFSEGFNPKPKLSYLTQPLAMGHTSECERIGFMLETEESEAAVSRALCECMPPGLEPVSARRVRPGGKTPVPDGMEYLIFVRKGAGEPGAGMPFSLPEGFEWMSPREAAPDEIGRARFFDSRNAANARTRGSDAEFIAECFSAAYAVRTEGGEKFRRPDRIILPTEPFAKEDFFFHRLREV